MLWLLFFFHCWFWYAWLLFEGGVYIPLESRGYQQTQVGISDTARHRAIELFTPLGRHSISLELATMIDAGGSTADLPQLEFLRV